MPGGSVNGRPFREGADSYTNTGIPCGNPKRYLSSEVVRMGGQNQAIKSKCLAGPVENIETEGDRQLQNLLKKQLDTNITIQEHFNLHRKFSDPVSYKPAIDSLTGAVTLDKYKDVSELDKHILELKQCGLTEEEIQLKLDSISTNKKPRLNLDPEVLKTKLGEIDRKITAKRKQLERPDTFSGVKKMGRHEMDLENAISHYRDGAKALTCLMTIERGESSSDGNHGNSVSCKDPMDSLPEILHQVMERAGSERKRDRRKKKRKEQLDEAEDSQYSDVQPQEESIDHLKQKWTPVVPKWKSNSLTAAEIPSPHNTAENDSEAGMELLKGSGNCGTPRFLHGDVLTIPEEDIIRNRLSLEKIQEIPRFQLYRPGEPNKTLYVKNLSPKVTEKDLVSLFIRFQKAAGPPIVFKLMTGRMKGQAFVTFDCEATASTALNLINGYMYKSKPVIIQYGKKQTKQADEISHIK